MLASAPAGQLDKWGAFYEKEPFGNPWLMMSIAVTNILNLFRRVLNSFAEEPLDEEQVDLPPDLFVPGRHVEEVDDVVREAPNNIKFQVSNIKKQFEARWGRH